MPDVVVGGREVADAWLDSVLLAPGVTLPLPCQVHILAFYWENRGGQVTYYA